MEYSLSNPIWNDFRIVPPLSWPNVQLSRGIWVLNDRWYCWAGQKARLPSHSSRRWPILGSSVSLLSVTRRSSSPLRNFKKKCSVFQLLRPIGLGPISLSNPRKVKDALVENNSWHIFHRVHFIFCWTLTTSPPENKEDLTQAIFRELGLGETLIVSQSELPAKFLDFLIATEEFWSQWVAGLV